MLNVVPNLVAIDLPRNYPDGNRFVAASFWLEETLFFDIPYRPLRFTLELPPIIIQSGIEVPMPTCYFEPFDISKNNFVKP